MEPLTRTPRRVKLRVEDYLALDNAGAFEAYGRTELLDGEVVYMNAQHRPHARIKGRLFRAIAERLDELGGHLEALVEGSVSMPPYNVPEPDIAITAEPEGEGLIPLASLALIVEVSDTSLRSDMGRKRKIYARGGVPEYWVVNVKSSLIHRMWSPAGEAFEKTDDVAFGEPLTSATIQGLTIDTSTL